jgi:hypothetical protein
MNEVKSRPPVVHRRDAVKTSVLNILPAVAASRKLVQKENDKWRRTGYAKKVYGPEKRTLHGGPDSLIMEWVGEHLLRWFQDLRDRKIKVTVDDFVYEYMALCPDECLDATKHALCQRMYRFLADNAITSRCVTHVSQNTVHCLIIIEDFVQYIKQIIARYGISLANIVNGDETNADWALPPKKTLSQKGNKTVEAQGSASSGRSTVFLCCTATGERLDPFVIFTGSKKGTIRKKELVRRDGYPLDMQFTTQKSAWMDEESMLEWIEVIWRPFTDGKVGMFLLLIDEAKAHLTAKVMRAIGTCRTILEIIPGGYTSRLQPVDVGVNKPFKKYYGDCSEEFVRRWICNNVAGVKPKPICVEVAKWIDTAWKAIRRETILNTWRHIGFITQEDVDEWIAPTHQGYFYTH